MLVLTRRPSESIIIANNIKITVVSVGPGRVKLGIEAPANVRVDRQEIHVKLEQAADVLAAVSAAPTPDTQSTLVGNGPDTAMIVSSDLPTAAPATGAAPGASGSTPPPLPLNKSRLPRKPR